MTQLDSITSTCAAQWKMWLIKVFSVIYFTALCAAEDSQDVTTTMFHDPPDITSVAPTIYVPPLPSLHLQSSWLDVFPLEKVEFSCNVTGSSEWTFTWFRDGLRIQDSDPKVSLSAAESVLTITAETSSRYSCKAQHKTKGVTTSDSNSLQLTVYANKPKPTVSQSPNFDKMFPGESVTFTCMVDTASGWEYLWFHNGTEIQVSSENAYTIGHIDYPNRGQYHCRAERGKGPFYTEESTQTTLQVSDPPKPSLTVRTPWPDVFPDETVGLICEVDSLLDWTFTWYRNQHVLEEDSDQTLDVDGSSSLNITSVTQRHQGSYACKAHLELRHSSGLSNTADVKVYNNTPKPTLSKDPGFSSMYVGETVNFTCNVDVSSGWEYQWYKDGKGHPATGKSISILLGSSHGGKYKCKAIRGETTTTDFSDEIPQDVLEIPVPSLKNITPWLDVFPTESVQLRCGMNGSSAWTYRWYRDGREVLADNVVSFDSNGATLSISSASDAHAGKYDCRGNMVGRSVSSKSSSGLTLKVYAKKPSVILMQDPEYRVMFPGEFVTFSCQMNVSSGWEYLWFQESNPLSVSGNQYTISPVGTTNTGSYTCQAKRGTNQVFLTSFSQAIQLQVEENKPKPSMTQKPDVDKVYTGESVFFECKVELSSGWEYLWYKDGGRAPLHNGSTLNIPNARSLNSGTYSCSARRDRTMFNTELSDKRFLNISEIPVPSLKQMTQWLDVFPTESVQLSCGMDGSSDWTYTWYKDGHMFPADRASLDLDGTTLSISSASAFHRGRYSCSAKLKSRSVSSNFSFGLELDVYDTKPRVTLLQYPYTNDMHTGDSVSFSCHINVSTGWQYLWYKDSSTLVESGLNHTIASVVTTNAGSYKCQAKRGRNTVFHSVESQAVKLNVMERPQAEIILLTGWSEVFSTNILVLKCGVQGEGQYSWNYTWFKEGQPINLPPSEKYQVTPVNDPEQSHYTCKGIRNGRPSYSKYSDSFKTKNLLVKRRVLLSISGCLFFGIIAVFLGCIVIRIFRKPADEYEKPEEADLFLSMAQRADAPCPLVQYITDATLNDSSKEGDENGTMCSETTPLPITPLDEQAVTTESHNTTESNGGLVSFRQ